MEAQELKTADILDSLENFLTNLNRQPEGNFACSQCGSTMEMIDTHFWLAGATKTWNVKLPFCLPCDLTQGEFSGKKLSENWEDVSPLARRKAA